jgi:beta-glucanase (GH16 family)
MSGPQDAADGISPFRFDPSGYLRIKAWFDSTRNHWRTGLLSSLGDAGAGFSVANGYYECRMWIPRAGGTWPAFWLETNNAWDSKRTTNAIEIDIAELYGDQAFHDPTHTDFTTVCHQQMHDWTPTGGNIAPPGSGQATTVIDPATGKKIDFAAGWHTYACLVQGSSITWYIDDQPTFMLPMPADGVNQPFFVMVDLALGGGWPIDDMPSPSPNANPPGFNRYPQELAIAWIRVYAH